MLAAVIVSLSTTLPKAIAQPWTPTSAPNLSWTAVASSADGTKLVAVANDPPTGAVYLSTDSGTNWTPATLPPGAWSSVASSADGTKLIVTGYDSPAGPVYISTDSGTTWTPAGISGHGWKGVASSADGNKLVLVADDHPAGPVFVSTNSGVDWTSAGISGHGWTSVASSADGTKLIATANEFPTGPVFKSANSGATWTQASVPAASWIAAACSADGSQLIIAGNNPPDGPVYRTINAGTNWTHSGAPSENYAAVAASADGTMLAVASAFINGVFGNIHISTNSGVTWQNSGAPVSAWSSLAASANGRKLVATAKGGGIFVRVEPEPVPPPMLRGFVTPSTGKFQLQFAGASNGLYTVLTSTDLVAWDALGIPTETAPGQFDFTDTAAASRPKKFYRLRSIAQPLANNPGFETGDISWWFPFGPATISVQTSEVHSGSYAALVTDRTETWMGIAQGLNGVLQTNQSYFISAWLRLASGPDQTMQLTMKKTDASGTTYSHVATGVISASRWTQLSGRYSLHYSGTLTELILFAEMPSNSSTAFYLDDLIVQ